MLSVAADESQIWHQQELGVRMKAHSIEVMVLLTSSAFERWAAPSAFRSFKERLPWSHEGGCQRLLTTAKLGNKTVRLKCAYFSSLSVVFFFNASQIAMRPSILPRMQMSLLERLPWSWGEWSVAADELN